MPKPQTRRDSPPSPTHRWGSSDRRKRLPPNWPEIRKKALRADKYACRWKLPSGERCGHYATDVDHIRRGDDHRPENLQALCKEHHKFKSAQEGSQALWKKRREISKRFQRVEEHPGLI